MTKDKIGTYMLYAIGEIVLVVGGILIAVQIDGWHKTNQEKEEGKVIVQNLFKELKMKQELIAVAIKEYEIGLNNKIVILKLIGSNRNELANTNIDSIYNSSFPLSTYKPSNSVFEDVVQSGRLKLIHNNELRLMLQQIDQSQKFILERIDKINKWTFEEELPFLSKHLSLKQMDVYSGSNWGGKSNVPIDYYPVFQLLEFENILENCVYLQDQMIKALQITQKEIEQAIEIIESIN